MKRDLSFVMLFACIGLGLLGVLPAAAQGTQKDSVAAIIRLSPDQLKAFAGFFQSSQNKDMVVQFIVSDTALNAKLLWNNGEVHLIPESQWGFVSKEGGDEGPIHLVFHRDSTGIVSQVNVANNGVWNRVKDYKPVVKKEMVHTPAQLVPFEGLYQLREDPNRFIQFSVRENNLVLKQVWDGNEILFVPESDITFFSKAQPKFSLDFSKDKDGNITQVVAFKTDVWIKQNKPALTPAILKSYEGKYRSQNDPDNEIKIIATDSNLVVRQLWDKKDRVLQPLTNIYFNNQDRSFPLVLVMDQGKVVQVVLLLGNVFDRVPESPAPKDTTPPAISLSPEQLKAYEGYYQMPQNEDVKLRAVLVGDTLHLRPVWNDVDFRLIPISDTAFYNLAEGGLVQQQFIFVKNSRGAVRALMPGGNIFWKKLVHYRPIEPKEITHTPEQLKIFEGLYGSETNKGAFVQLTQRDNKLILRQYWNGEEVAFIPDSTLHFFSMEERLLKLKFYQAADGAIRGMQAFNKENFKKIKQPMVTPGLLKTFEGKYRLKADSDDIIRITARDSGLVLKQLWDGKEIAVSMLAKSFFYNKDQAFTLYFRKDKGGIVIGAVALDTEEFEKMK